jgi:hypothetical protein
MIRLLPIALLLACSAFLPFFAGCGPASAPSHIHALDPVLLDPAAPQPDRAKSAALTAAQTAALAGDISHLIAQGFALQSLPPGVSLGAPPLPGQLTFQAPARCTHQLALGGRRVSLEDDCSTPSGRRLHGSLSIGGGCAPFGFTVEYHLAIESIPGAGDRLLVDGAVNLGLGHHRMNLATSLEMRAEDGGHSVAQSIAACTILDLDRSLFAMNGHVTTNVDNRALVELGIDDLETQLCEALPYTGSIHLMDPIDTISVTFDQATPKERRVTVIVDSDRYTVELPDEVPVRWCSPQTALPVPMTIDYATCGGCTQPAPPPMQPVPPGMSSGGTNNNNNPGGTIGPDGSGL